MAALTLQFDPQEVRIETDRMAVLVTNTEAGRLQWDFSDTGGSENIAIDPATNTAILAPINYLSTWYTSSRTGYLIRKADTDRAASASWIEKNLGFSGNIYLHALGVNQAITTTASYEKNMPWWFSYYAYGQGDSFRQLRVSFGPSGSTQILLDFWTDNSVHVYKGGTFIGAVNLSRSQAWEAAMRNIEGGEFDNNQNRPIDIFVLPCRRRELIIVSTAGGVGNFVFDDIDKFAADPVIIPAGVMAMTVSDGATTIQAAPAKKAGWSAAFFQTSGFLLSKTIELRQAPASGATATCTAFYDVPYYDTTPTVTASLVDTDGTTPFVGNGIKTECKMKIAFTSDGKNTPFVYGGQAVFAAVTTNTANTPWTADDYQIEGELHVPDIPTDVTFDVVIKDIPTVEPLLPKIKRISNRPIVAKVGTIAIITGRNQNPRWHDSPRDTAQTVMMELRDRWKSFEHKRITDPTPFDGRNIEDVIEELARLPGYPDADMDVEPFGVPLDSQGQASKGDFALLPAEGDTVSEWLLRLWEDYAKTCVMGWYPSATGPMFRFRLPAEFGGTLSGTATATVYSTKAAAITAGFTEANHHLHVYHDYDEDDLQIEANDIRVTGWDKRIGKAFQAHEEDSASKTPATAVASRPDNWVGEPWEVALWDPSITTQSMANYCAAILRYRLTNLRKVAIWSCQMQFKSDESPLWRGDVMSLNAHGRYRILSFGVDFILENTGRQVRNATYIGEYIGS